MNRYDGGDHVGVKGVKYRKWGMFDYFHGCYQAEYYVS